MPLSYPVSANVEVQKFENGVPRALIICILILIYLTVLILGFVVRKCLLQKGVSVGPCPRIECCSCSEFGLRIAETFSCCSPDLSFSRLLDYLCPSKENCTCGLFSTTKNCDENLSCGWLTSPLFPPFLPSKFCRSCCESCQDFAITCGSCCSQNCNFSNFCDCSTLDCLCCEISIKGRA
ncbi:UNVERIFIED_CONTAM: hypothetical protein RMT77_004184 [Armadillidium vulgare]